MASWMPDGGTRDSRFMVKATARFTVLDLGGPASSGGSKGKAGGKAAAASSGGSKGKAGGGGKAAAAAAANGGGGGGGGQTRLRHIRANEQRIQAEWEKARPFEVNPCFNEDGSPKPKFMVTFPYPYMNGRLHLGHAFSLTKAEFATGYKRIKGFNALFPFGFHCTGMPIQAAANKLKAEIAKYGNPPQFPVEESTAASSKASSGKKKAKVAAKASGSSYQWQTLVKMNIPEEEVAEFAEPIKWLNFFPPFGMKDLKKFGAAIDWRRSFITTAVNPFYNAFVEWQFRQLKQSDKISFGKRPCIYSPLDGQVCADHDRAEGEGVGPQEYTLIKLRVKEPLPGKLGALAGQNVFLAPATLRPETMYGQTNCFVLPDGDYGAFKWANGDVLVMSHRSAKGLAHQSYQNVDYAEKWGETNCLLELKGWDILGIPLSAPRAPYDTVYTLPLLSISMGKGTGVVTSVPSDAPDDYVALKELQAKPEFRAKFNLTDEMVMPYHVVPIINITVPATDKGEDGWSSDQAAEFWSEKLGIKTAGERQKLDEAKRKTYNTGFTFGVMLVGKYKGEKVNVAKTKEKLDMVDAGEALIYNEPEGFVKSRTGEECVVAMTDQWYLRYGEEEWKQSVLSHVNDPSKFQPYSQEILDRFNFTLGWLKEWACSRLFGLGTQLPWDEKWVIESLSDSTIYMAYYTIANHLQGPDNLSGDKPSPSGITADQLNDGVFNYIFLRGPYPASCTIPEAKLEAMRAEFEYWYPMDLRVSGKDLIGNHLTMALYNHAAIWKDRPELWPRGYYTNGHVNLNNAKMSKSTGNFLMLEEAVEKFSADATRYALADAGDSLEDANFETDVANSATMMLYLEEQFAADVAEQRKQGKLRSGELFKVDQQVLNEMNRLIDEADGFFERMLWRDGVNAGSSLYRNLRDFYREWCSKMGVPMHADVIIRWLETSVVMLSPICPHFAEVVWGMLGNSGSVLRATWPETQPVDPRSARELQFLLKSVKHLRGIASKEKVKNPKRVHIYIADQYTDWKVDTLKQMQTLWNPSTRSLPEKKQLLSALTSWVAEDASRNKKLVMQFASFMADEAKQVGFSALETEILVDQRAILEESREYISKHLINNLTLDVVFISISDTASIVGPEKKWRASEPMKPSVFLE